MTLKTGHHLFIFSILDVCFKNLDAELMVAFSSHSRSLALKLSWKSYQMTPISVQKERSGEKIIIWVKKDDVFTLKSWRLERKRTRVREKNGTRNSPPKEKVLVTPHMCVL